MRMTDALRTRLRDALAEADGAEPTPERARELERRVEEAAREGRCRVDFEGAASEASIAFRPYRDAESGEWRAAADGERVAELVSRAHLEAEAARGPREDGPMLVADAADGTGSWLGYNGAPAPGGPSLGTFDSRGEAALFARGVGLPLRADMAAWRAADREALRRGSAAQSLLDGPWGIRGEEVHGVIDAAERAWRMLGASRPLDWIASILADALAETEGGSPSPTRPDCPKTSSRGSSARPWKGARGAFSTNATSRSSKSPPIPNGPERRERGGREGRARRGSSRRCPCPRPIPAACGGRSTRWTPRRERSERRRRASRPGTGASRSAPSTSSAARPSPSPIRGSRPPRTWRLPRAAPGGAGWASGWTTRGARRTKGAPRRKGRKAGRPDSRERRSR